MNLSSLGSRWFAIQVKTRHEQTTSIVLRNKGYEEFLPLVLSKRRPSEMYAIDGAFRRKVLYPGYVFCRFDPSVQAPIVTTPGVIRIVGYNRKPVPVSEQEIMNIKLISQSGAPVSAWPVLNAGDPVRIVEGPLRGCVGVLLRERSVYRLVVSVDILQRSSAVELEASWVESAQDEIGCNHRWKGQRVA